MVKHPAYTGAEVRRIATDWNAGMYMNEMVKKHGRSADSIFYIMKQNRDLFTRRHAPKRPHKVNTEELETLFDAGMSVAEMADVFEATQLAVYIALGKMTERRRAERNSRTQAHS